MEPGRSRRRARSGEARAFDAVVVDVEPDGSHLSRDETVRPGTTVESLSRLGTAFTGSASRPTENASALHDDGASAVVVAAAASAQGLRARVRVVGYAVAGVEPS